HLLTAWNPAGEAQPDPVPLHRRFAAEAARRPEAPAVTCGEVTWTYGELSQRANRIARRLRRLGVGPEERVGLRMERSAEAVAGLLGILLAGGAYVPLDPEIPAERLAFTLEDAGCRVLVSEESLEAIDRESPEDPGVEVLAEAAAYVIYTSGSTGRPKGVVVTHANAARLFDATRRWVDFGPEDVTPLFHSLAFDFSVWELWGALAHGGRLVVVPTEIARSAEALLELLARERVTVLNQTPSAFRQLVQADDGTADLALRLVIFGGEALEPASLAPWFARRGDAVPRLVNMYGITETTVHVTWRPLRAADTKSAIGEPIPDLRVHLLDRHLEPVPLLVPGEIHVGGAGLARGYLGRPELTAERFVPDPFGPPGARLYRSGDLARRLPDGDLEYLGRIDTQVKIRGFRIELGEIEAALASHPEVREAVVVAREAADGDRRLIAYVVPAGDGLTVPGLRSHLGERLPAYMVPAAFVRMERLPLTGNGKLDRKALPEPDDERPETGADYQAPRGPAEELIAGVWADLLGLERVGARDDFFELGGHSLLAARAVSRLREPLGVDLPLAALFESPTVAGLAAAAERSRGLRSPGEAPPLSRAAREEDPPLSFAQERLWFLSRLEPDDPAYNITAAVRLRGEASAAALGAALETIAGRHEILRTTFREVGGRPRQVVAPRAFVPLPVLDLSGLPGSAGEAEALRLAGEEARRPCDLSRGPLVRAALVRRGPGESLLLLTLHHIVADGWSMGVLLAELTALYGAALAGGEARLPALPLQYADYAVWQRGWLAGEALAARLAGWREALAGAPPVFELPGDRPRPPVRSPRGGSVPVSLGEETARALRTASRGKGATLFMTLLAAFQTLLLRSGSGEDLLIGTPVAGRDRLETERLIGLFVNTVVLRGDLSGDPSFGALLARVREATLSAFARQDLPFEKLVEELAPERSLSQAPLVQVAFALQNAPLGPLALPGLSLEPLPFDRGIAQLDLSLTLAEDGGELRGDFEYSADLFDAATVERLAGSFRTLVRGIAAGPEARLSELPLLSASERRQLVVEWNGTAGEGGGGLLLDRLFAAQAARSPEAVALLGPGGERLTYRELDRRAEELARRLYRTGVGPDVPVGVFLER
ncbi:MAG TPA: amino acid adenylation domain-containing protein, partial [Thermoanaerobaculia bacterium]|nr:amino acid adenylation domain-containing protein [Thermoanaerobaculia bacterium]